MNSIEKKIIDFIDECSLDLHNLAENIGKEPELGYSEYKAVRTIIDLLAKNGVQAEVGLGDLNTAFRTGAGPATSSFAILAEYDALPEIGHACGHNIIAASAVGAYLALRAVVPQVPVTLIGCPAEESTVPNAGGKIKLLELGVFDSVIAAFMIHPYETSGIVTKGSLAARGFDFIFKGKSAHAAMSPEDGLNALDAAVLMYNAISVLRQQLSSQVRVHGVITDGGDSPNVIPARAALRYRVRSNTIVDLEQVSERIVACAEGAANATQTTLEIDEFMPPYAETIQNQELSKIAFQVLNDLRINMIGAEDLRFGSSDFGNVSQLVPAVEIGIGLGVPGAKPHTAAFAAAAVSDSGLNAAITGAQAIALSVYRSFTTNLMT